MHIHNPYFSGSIRQSSSSLAYLSGSFTGSLLGTASYALSVESASYAVTSSFTETSLTASYVSGSSVDGAVTLATSASYISGANVVGKVASALSADTVTSASYAITASFALNAGGGTDTGSLLTTASVTGSTITFTKGDSTTFDITVAQSGSVETASYVETAQTASYIQTAQTASFVTASNVYGPYGANSVVSASYAVSASHEIITEISSSHAVNADTASFVTASNIQGTVANATSASFTSTASYIDPTFISESAAASGFGSTGVSTDTGSFYISSSVSLNTITFNQGDGTSESVTINTGSSTISSSYAVTASYAENATFDSSSLVTTGSVSSNVLTFTKGDGTTFNLTVDTGSGGDTGSLLTTASISDATITFTKGDGTTFNITADNVNTASHALTAVSASYAISASHEIVFETSASWAQTASFALNAASADNADTASFVTASNVVGTIDSASVAISANTAITASYVSASNIDGTITSASYAISSSLAATASTAVSSSYALSASYAVTSSHSEPLFDGNRAVTNAQMGDLFSASFNPGTSGSIQDFLEQVFYPINSAPVFTSNQNISIQEFEASGSSIHTLTATDTDGNPLTFRTQSSYTDDFVRVATNGIVTLNTASIESLFNTSDRGDGTLAHPVQVQVNDTIVNVNRTIYINVIPNEAPVFRQTSTEGAIITSFTASRNENASITGSPHYSIYITDANSDTITLESSSLPISPNGDSVFNVSRTGSRINISQITSSLDYETTSSFTFSLTASDNHYQDGDDLAALSALPVTISVTDNLQPTVNDQAFTSASESGSVSRLMGTLVASDNESDSITFINFTTSSKAIDGSLVSAGTYGNTGKNDPSEEPFTMNSSGQVTQKAGHFLNSDLINTYQYTFQVKDAFNTASNTGTLSINLSDDPAPTLSDNWSAGPYIIESAVSASLVRINDNGRTGTQADIDSSQANTTFTSSNNQVSIDSNGGLSLGFNLSGSGTGSGDTLSTTITGTNNFGTTSSLAVNISVSLNPGPTGSFDTSAYFVTDFQARSGSTFYTLTWVDNEGDTIDHTSFNFIDPSGQLNAIRSASSNVYEIQARNQLSSSTTPGDYNYQFTASIFDQHRFASQSISDNLGVVTASLGTLGGDTSGFIVESSTDGQNIFTTQTVDGTTAALSVSYDVTNPPLNKSGLVQAFNSAQSVNSYTSSTQTLNPGIAIVFGELRLTGSLSGSTTQSGDTITSVISYQDQYGNIGSGSVSVTVFDDAPATASFTSYTNNWTASVPSGSDLMSASLSDTEDASTIYGAYSSTAFSMSLSGDVGTLRAIPVADGAAYDSSSYKIQNSVEITTGSTLNFTASIFDAYNNETQVTQTITIQGAPPIWYAYLDENGGYASSEANALTMYGDTNDDGTTDSGTSFEAFTKGQIGDSTITTTAFSAIAGNPNTLYLVASGSFLTGSNSTPILTGLNFSTGSVSQTGLHILFPSGSGGNFTKPISMGNALSDSTTGRYALYGDATGTGVGDAVRTSYVRYFDFSGSVTYPNSSEDRFGVIFSQNGATNPLNIFFMSTSGSAPSSQI